MFLLFFLLTITSSQLYEVAKSRENKCSHQPYPFVFTGNLKTELFPFYLWKFGICNVYFALFRNVNNDQLWVHRIFFMLKINFLAINKHFVDINCQRFIFLFPRLSGFLEILVQCFAKLSIRLMSATILQIIKWRTWSINISKSLFLNVFQTFTFWCQNIDSFQIS